MKSKHGVYPKRIEFVVKNHGSYEVTSPDELGDLEPLKTLFAHGARHIKIGPGRGYVYRKVAECHDYTGIHMVYERR
jgi:hypothetical protein